MLAICLYLWAPAHVEHTARRGRHPVYGEFEAATRGMDDVVSKLVTCFADLVV